MGPGFVLKPLRTRLEPRIITVLDYITQLVLFFFFNRLLIRLETLRTHHGHDQAFSTVTQTLTQKPLGHNLDWDQTFFSGYSD